MYPDDRVLVGVISRKKDFLFARDEHWYRIPQKRMPNGINTEYVAFFLSGKPFKEQSGGVHYFARVQGLELVRRKDLLPDEDKRADEVYYKVQLSELIEKDPPIINESKRTITFVYTTWDRFVHATTIRDLYSQADYFVDRIYHALRNRGVHASIYWSTDYRNTGIPAQIRVLCDNGSNIVISSEPEGDDLNLLDYDPEDKILKAIFDKIARNGGPASIDIPLV